MNMAETVTTRNSWDDLRPPRRLVLLSESDGLVTLLRYTIGRNGQLTRFASLPEALDLDGLDDADAVVLDLPATATTPPSRSFATTIAASSSCSLSVATAAAASPPARHRRCWSGRSPPRTWPAP
jgi:hypothetical protein